jgi:hypothetical protein
LNFSDSFVTLRFDEGMGTHFAGRAFRQNAQIAFLWVTQPWVNPVDSIFFWDWQFRTTLLRLI